jgi:hypothetical protein
LLRRKEKKFSLISLRTQEHQNPTQINTPSFLFVVSSLNQQHHLRKNPKKFRNLGFDHREKNMQNTKKKKKKKKKVCPAEQKMS